MSDNLSSAASPPRCVMILVHGTWGRGFNPSDPFVDSARNLPGNTIPAPRWFDLGSAFRSRLERALEENLHIAFEPFHWSGANSVFARNDAALTLCERLKSLHSKGEQIVIIAHSHGGNVALRALELLGSDARRIRLITLATPFLRLRATEAASSIIFYLFLPIAFFIASLGFLGRSFLLPLSDPSDPSFAQAFQLAAVHLLVAAILLSALASWIAIRYFLNLSGKGRWGRHPEELANAAYYDTSSVDAPQMLVLRGVDDEAGFALSSGALGSRLSFMFVTRWIPRLFFRAAFGLLSLVFAGWLAGLIEVATGGYVWIMYILSLWLVILIALPGMFKSVFGKELLFGSLRCEIAVDSSPDGCKHIEVMTLSVNPLKVSSPISLADIPFATEVINFVRRKRLDPDEDVALRPSSLRHAIYDDPRAPEPGSCEP